MTDLPESRVIATGSDRTLSKIAEFDAIFKHAKPG